MASRQCARCLVVDEDPFLRWSLVRFLEPHCLEARSLGSWDLGFALLRDWPADLLILDARLSTITGAGWVERCRDLRPRPGIILLTSGGATPLPMELERLGVIAVLEKPFVLDSLARLFTSIPENPGRPVR